MGREEVSARKKARELAVNVHVLRRVFIIARICGKRRKKYEQIDFGKSNPKNRRSKRKIERRQRAAGTRTRTRAHIRRDKGHTRQ